MKSVSTIGLGYIGLPTSALIASNGMHVHGVDINESVVETINRGEIHIVEPELINVVKEVIDNGYLTASCSTIKSDIYIIVVPTPFKGDHEPDVSFVESATKSVIPLLKEGDLYIIESTCPVGTTEKMRDLIFNLRPDLIGEIDIAYCPERVLPGNIMHELVYNDRVIGGIDEKSTLSAKSFYKKFVKGKLHSTNARTAEMCKLVENSSRDVQIAFANELSITCEDLKIDVWELIHLANMHPRVNILDPSCGVGGHCIAVDPYFLISAAPKTTKLTKAAREINTYKQAWCVEKILNTKLDFEKQNSRKPKIAFLGLTYKPNIDDLRESPAEYIAKNVIGHLSENEYYIVEPNISSHDEFTLSLYETAINEADIISILVKHDEFMKLRSIEGKVILDFCGIN